MKLAEVFFVIVLAGLMGLPVAAAQDEGTEAIAQKQFEALVREKQYDGAMALAKKELDALEKKVGPNHPDMAAQLEKFAEALGYSEGSQLAEKLYKRALAIRETILGADNLNLAPYLESLADFYEWRAASFLVYGIGRYQERQDWHRQAAAILDRVIAIREQGLGKTHPDVLRNIDQLSGVYINLNRSTDAKILLERATDETQKALGASDPAYANQLVRLGTFHAIHARYPEAEMLYKRAMAIHEEVLGPDHLDVASDAWELGHIYIDQKLYVQAEPYFERALAIWGQGLGPDERKTVNAMTQLARLKFYQGQYGKAEKLYRRILAIQEKTLKPGSVEIAGTLEALALTYGHQGRFDLAKPLYERSLEIKRKQYGEDDRSLAYPEMQLADANYHLGFHKEAAPLYLQALSHDLNKKWVSEQLFQQALYSNEQALGLEAEPVVEALDWLATFYDARERFAEADKLRLRVLSIREKMNGPESLQVATALHRLAASLTSRAPARAEPLLLRTLSITEKNQGSHHPLVANVLNSLAANHMNQGQYSQAEPLLKRSLAIEESLSSDHKSKRLENVIGNLAYLYSNTSQESLAKPLLARAIAITEKNYDPVSPALISPLNNLAFISSPGEAEKLMKRALKIAEDAYGPDSDGTLEVASRHIGLHMDHGRYHEALTGSRRVFEMNRRYVTSGADSDATRLLMQKKWRPNFLTHIALLLDHGQQSPDWQTDAFDAAQLARESSVGQSVAQMAARLAKTDAELSQLIRLQQDKASLLKQANEKFVESIGQVPAHRDRKQEAGLRGTILLLEKELQANRREISKRFPRYDSLVSLAPVSLTEAQSLLAPDEALVYYLTGYNESVTKFAPLRKVYAWVLRKDSVRLIRVAITSEELDKQVGTLRSRLDIEQNIELKPFDVAASHELYKRIFAPLESSLVGVKHVIVVPDGSLQSLPLSILVDRKPKKKGKPSWLIDHYALSTVPSVAALRALRAVDRKTVTDTTRFIGFGDPVLNGTPANHRSLAVRGLYGAGAESKSEQLSVADVGAIRQIVALPDTADELRALAKTLSAPADNLYLGMRATETAVKNVDLSNVRILAFATHGVVAGELTGITEPGLILTPPEKGTEMDDGYLSASEVVQLKLNADLVLLSACNTAAPDGKPGAEGLSGLAKAFFYAGARSLLVSNWVVVSHASTRLTTGMLKHYSDNGKSGRAEALRQSILDLKRNPDYAHPLYWAPFVVVGEGRVR